MKISNISFSDYEISQLKEFRDKQKNSKLKIRFIALLLPATDASIENVSFVVGCTAETIKNWVRIYKTEGPESLNTYKYKPKKPYLTFSQISQVVIFVIFNSPRSAEEIREYIKDRFNICHCDESVRQLLKKRGLRFIRPGTVPGSPPSPEEQRQFIQQYDELRSNPEIKVLFGGSVRQLDIEPATV